MPGCKICRSDVLHEARTLDCGHQFCEDCLLALLPSSRSPVSILPQYFAVISCPQCQRQTEFSKLSWDVYSCGRDLGTNKAPSPTPADKAASERRRRCKRAHFLEAYWQNNEGLNRKSRSRIYHLFEEGEACISTQQHRDAKSSRSGYVKDSFRWDRTAKYGPTERERKTEIIKDDIRAIDHINGRFVACTIISSPVHPQDLTGHATQGSCLDQRPRKLRCHAPGFYGVRTARRGGHSLRQEFDRTSRATAGNKSLPNSSVDIQTPSSPTNTTKRCCVVGAILLVVLLFVGFVMTSIASF